MLCSRITLVTHAQIIYPVHAQNATVDRRRPKRLSGHESSLLYLYPDIVPSHLDFDIAAIP